MLGMKRKQEGDGVFMRDPGKLPPAGRQLLAQVGNEPITSIEIVRTPLSSFTKGFLNVISLGQFEKISKKYYDEMFHLSLWINGKYNLEKNEVVNFSRKNPKEAKSQSKPINQIPSGITLQQLIDNTIKRMGPQNFSTYDAQNLNCQNFLVNILDANNIGDSSDKSFIVQDADKIFKELPEFSKVLGNAATNLGAIFNRLIKGEGDPKSLKELSLEKIKEQIKMIEADIDPNDAPKRFGISVGKYRRLKQKYPELLDAVSVAETGEMSGRGCMCHGGPQTGDGFFSEVYNDPALQGIAKVAYNTLGKPLVQNLANTAIKTYRMSQGGSIAHRSYASSLMR